MEDQVGMPPETGKKKWIWLGLGALGLLLAAGAVLVFGVNRFYVDVVPLGQGAVTVEYGEEYRDEGAKAMLRGTMFLQQGICPEELVLTTQNNVDTGVLGNQTVSYEAELWGMTARAKRDVAVVDTVAPEITLVDSGKPLIAGAPYEEEGFTATDNYDGDITARVHRQELFGKVIYTVADTSGNETVMEREIPYYDPLPPTILLEGEPNIRLQVGRAYEEPGFLALDNVDGDLTQLVEIEGEVDCFVPGQYTITYRATDGFFNQTAVERTVEVVREPRVDVKYPNGKVIYLTFDDGPGPFTDELLYLLDYYNVKATFFVTDSGYPELMKRIVEEGHSIAIHTVDHDYDRIYQDPGSYFADLYAMQDIIYQHTGVMTTMMRFPGGGSNLVSKRLYPGLMTLLTEAVQDAGFQYFDWNVDSNDAGGAVSRKKVAENVIAGVQEQRVSVVLQHDIHPYSVNAVEDIILWGLDHGYRFLPLQEDSPPCHHPVYN